MSVSYEAAMSTLQSMFASVDAEVIAMVLQMNNGHMERTVENLLAMATGEGGGSAGGGGGSSAPAPSSSATNSSSRSSNNSGDATISTSHSILADDFLRPPSYFVAIYGEPVRKSSGNLSQMEQDMLLAQMLQDEMFLEDLRNNPDFYLGSLEPAPYASAAPASHSAAAAPSTASAATASASSAPSRGSAAPSSSSSSSSAAVSSAPFVSTTASASSRAHGDFTGIGASTGTGSHSSSMRERWSSLTSTAKKRLMSLASKLKSDRSSNDGASDDYNLFEDDPAGGGSSAATGGGGGAAPQRKTNIAGPVASDDVVLEESDGEEDDDNSSSGSSSATRGRKGRSSNDALGSRLL